MIAVFTCGVPTLRVPSKQAYAVLAKLNNDIECAIADVLGVARDGITSYVDQYAWSARRGKEVNVFIDGLPDVDEYMTNDVQERVHLLVSEFAKQWFPGFERATVTIRSTARSSQTMTRV